MAHSASLRLLELEVIGVEFKGHPLGSRMLNKISDGLYVKDALDSSHCLILAT